LDAVLWRCRDLYNTALEQRITAWQRCRVSVSRYEQEAELKAIRAEFPEYAAIHSHVLQDVLARLEKTYQAFFCRPQRGEKAGFPRFKGRHRFHSFTFKEYGNGARLDFVSDNGYLVLAKIGRIAHRWHAQNRHHFQRGRRVVCRHFMRRCANTAVAAYWSGDGHRPRIGILCHAF
jgi:putative transposase